MFDWFWNFLYLITYSIFRLIDGLIDSSMYICGMKTIQIDGDDTDLLTWIMSRPEIKTGFSVACLVGITLIVFFSIWQIVKICTSDEVKGTPGQICMKAFKSVLTFLFVPAIMISLLAAMNIIGKVMYDGTLASSSITLGKYLALSFGRDAAKNPIDYAELLAGTRAVDYTSCGSMRIYFDLSDYDYFFAWVAGISILFTLAKALFIFVDRMFSIVILYIISPFAISSSIVDEGQRFKSWRDQILIKFLTGYATIVGINIFSVIISNICTADITFFPDNSFLDFILKIVIVLGGTVSLNRIIALVGNIVQQGAGEAELRNANEMFAGFKGKVSKAFSGVKAAVGLFTGKGGGAKGGAKGGAMSPQASGIGGGDSKPDENGNDGSDNKNPLAGKEQATTNGDNSKTSIAVTNAINGTKDDKKKEETNKGPEKKNLKNDAVSKVMGKNSVTSEGKDKGGNKR